MHFAIYSSSGAPYSLRIGGNSNIVGRHRSDNTTRRRRALRVLDRALSRRKYDAALTLVERLQAPSGAGGGLLRAFGAALQVPQRISSIEEMKCSEIDPASLQCLIDLILTLIKNCSRLGSQNWVSLERLETLMHEQSTESIYESIHLRCIQHEAGHFLVAYLLGVLPQGYKIPSLETLRQNRYAKGRVELAGPSYSPQVIKEKKSSMNLNRFSCIALGGIVAEHLVFGYAKGLKSDVETLDRMLKLSGFGESEADSQVRWAILNTAMILHQHNGARTRLVDAMATGRSVGFCIDTIENAIDGCN